MRARNHVMNWGYTTLLTSSRVNVIEADLLKYPSQCLSVCITHIFDEINIQFVCFLPSACEHLWHDEFPKIRQNLRGGF